MKSYCLLFLILVLSCKESNEQKNIALITQQQNIDYLFDQNNLIKHIQTLSSDAFEGRRTGTAGATKAKDYIINQYKTLNVKPFGETYEQQFTFKRRKTYQATNVLGIIKGTEHTSKYIVISAHYDHEGIKNNQIYNGADDDASGVSAMFAFAEYFAKNPPKHNVVLAAFDAEELGLKGAYHFVKDSNDNNKDIVLNLNMDMISRSDENQLFAVGTRYYPKLKPTIKNFKDIGKVDLLIGHEGLTKGDNWTNSSDHAAFHKAKIPFIYFGVADHEDYHKPTDDFEKIHQQFYKDAVQTIITVFSQLDDLDL